VYAIEVAHAFAEDPDTRDLAIDTVAWIDEEGTYTSCLGSTSFVGELTDAVLEHANAAGETVGAAIERVGLGATPTLHLETDRHVGYLEAHIEQGPHLDDAGLRIGVVTSIVGIGSMRVTFAGEQNHAGTTPMDRRRDAGSALFDFAVRVRERLGAVAGPTSVWTIGNARLEPGAESIIPGAAWLTLQFRDPDPATLAGMEGAVTSLAAEMTAQGPVTVSAARRREPMMPATMDRDLRRHIARAAEGRVPGSWVEMPSAAIHDATVVSRHVPCGMLFVPSIAGISHDFAEDTAADDIVTGCQVLADAAASILRDRRPRDELSDRP
jgi:N-carbamoyl-L-amino-acid hydrolase